MHLQGVDCGPELALGGETGLVDIWPWISSTPQDSLLGLPFRATKMISNVLRTCKSLQVSSLALFEEKSVVIQKALKP